MSDFADEEFATSAEDEFAEKPAGSFSGAVADTLFSTVKPLANVMKAFGQHAQDNWGEGVLRPAQETDDWMKKHGVYNDYQEGNKNFIKGLNETFMRPVIYSGIAAIKGVEAGLAGAIGATEQTAQELDTAGKTLSDNPNLTGLSGIAGKVVGEPLRAGGELVGDLAGGALPDGGAPHVANVARAKAVIGEGEIGHFNTREVTPPEVQARAAAADATGTAMKAIEPPVFDIDTIARKVSPDTYNELDKLRAEQARLRDEIANRSKELSDQSKVLTGEAPLLSGKRDAWLNDVIEKNQQKLQDTDYALRDLIPDQVRARESATELLNGQSKESEAFRDYLQAERLEQAIKMDSLADEAQIAQTHAELLVPSVAEQAATMKKIKKNVKSKEAGPPPVKEGFTRLYHGAAEGSGPETGGARWFSRSQDYARHYNSHGVDKDVYYVDVPNDHPDLPSGFHGGAVGSADEGIAPLSNVQLPEALSKKAKPYEVPSVSSRPSTTSSEDIQVPPSVQEVIDSHLSPQIQETTGSGDPKTRGLAQNIEASAVEKGLTEGFGDLPQYRSINMKEQAQKVADLINSDYEQAKRIAFNEELPPHDIHTASVLVGVEKHAQAIGDVPTLRRLATDPGVASKYTDAAQALRVLQERGGEYTPINSIKELDKTRKEILERDPVKRAKAEIIKSANEAIDMFKSDWESFVRSIECD